MTIRTLTLAAVLLSTIGAGPATRTYTVKRGDTLSKISKKVGVKASELAKANRLSNVHRLSIGQQLTLPGSVATPQAATVTMVEVGMQTAQLFERSGANSRSIQTLERGSTGTLIRESDGWSQIRLASGSVGWAKTEVLTVGMPSFLVAKSTKPKPAKAAVAKHVSPQPLLAKAYSFRGVRYRYGGTSRSGIDCSGFTSAVFRSQGIELPRTAAQQSRIGSCVARKSLKPGDLVFFRTRGRRIGHVGIFVGDDSFIHAATSAGHVRVDSLDHTYYRQRFTTARRVL